MNKFLAVFDGYNLAESTLQYGLQLARDADAHLTGLFLDDYLYHTYPVNDVVLHKPHPEEVIKQLDAADKEKRDEAARRFQSASEKAGVRFSIHRNTDNALQELLKESLFADLVIINEHETFGGKNQSSPTGFITDLLTDVKCPVLVVPDHYAPVDKIVLLYNGEASSLHAIKMYSYLLGSALRVPVEVLTVKEELIPVLRLPQNKLMRDFVKCHFLDAEYTVVNGVTEQTVVEHISNYGGNQLVVLGAYGRSALSTWFRESMGNILLKKLNVPLFIAHES